MIGQLFATIPSQGFEEFLWQPPRLFDQRRDHALGVFVGQFDQHDIARLPLDKCRDVAVPGAANKITFPMPRHRSGCENADTNLPLSILLFHGDNPSFYIVTGQVVTELLGHKDDLVSRLQLRQFFCEVAALPEGIIESDNEIAAARQNA